MTVTVVNKYRQPNHIYCGRGSALGNPFPMHNESQRDAVCDEYEKYFYEKVYDLFEHDTQFHVELKAIIAVADKGDVNLGCFCAPKRCHCDTIKKFIDDTINVQEELYLEED